MIIQREHFPMKTSAIEPLSSVRRPLVGRALTWAPTLATSFLLSLAPAALSAQTDADPAERPVMAAAVVDAAPVLDGDVLGEAIWSQAHPATGFVQTTPKAGAPASERTEVFVIIRAETLYLGVVCHDREPEGIVIADSRRDSSLQETDSFQVLLDTYGDDQSGFIFGTNPAGVQYDGQVSKDGEVDVGATGGFNLEWDGGWEVAAKVFEGGWSAEFAIPFSTLRFAEGSPQTWGINFQRNIRRNKEKVFWSPLPRQFDLDRVSLAGEITGIEIPHQRFLQVTPYVLGEFSKGLDGTRNSDEDFDAGVDIKYGISPSLTLDVTYNTDFAQVEADAQQINLNRFSLFFPEKRPFFLENAGLFRIGIPTEVELFHSRRIGLGSDGSTIPIIGGARLSGKMGRNNIGLIYMATDDVSGVTEKDEFGVIRLSRDLGENSSVGMLVTHRSGQGAATGDADKGSTFALDGRWSVTPQAEVLAFAALTDSPDAEGDEHAFRLRGRWNSKTYVGEISYTEIGDDFNPEIGFLNRRGYRRPEIYGLARYRPNELLGLHEIRPHVFFQQFYDFDGDLESGIVHVGSHWEWKNSHEIHTGANFREEGVKEAFEIFPGVVVPVGEYNNDEVQLVGYTNRGLPIGFEMTVIAGSFFGGDRVNLMPVFRFRTGEKFNGSIIWNHNNVNLPGGDFDADLARLRLSYSFTPKIFLESLIQYNTAVDEWSSNIRFGWRDTANTGLFLVYNEIQDIGRSTDPNQKQLIIKYSRTFDFLK
ncbi:MAG: carbohydrate binding family 9 domain-containing protein [Deltaproteobacteria bacterium]|nr:carbohydrate binding family 9 domain-containing protein [Deltaproteobacteria bacterium]